MRSFTLFIHTENSEKNQDRESNVVIFDPLFHCDSLSISNAIIIRSPCSFPNIDFKKCQTTRNINQNSNVIDNTGDLIKNEA